LEELLHLFLNDNDKAVSGIHARVVDDKIIIRSKGRTAPNVDFILVVRAEVDYE
jgi:hypothetical protein